MQGMLLFIYFFLISECYFLNKNRFNFLCLKLKKLMTRKTKNIKKKKGMFLVHISYFLFPITGMVIGTLFHISYLLLQEW